MDRTDQRITTLLQADARMSFAEIGRRIGLSRTAVQDRVTRLEQSGQITGYHAALSDPGAAGLRAVIFVQIATRPCQPVLQWLRDQDGVVAVQSLAGEVDAIVQCQLATAEELTRLNDKIGAYPGVSGATSQLVLTQI